MPMHCICLVFVFVLYVLLCLHLPCFCILICICICICLVFVDSDDSSQSNLVLLEVSYANTAGQRPQQVTSPALICSAAHHSPLLECCYLCPDFMQHVLRDHDMPSHFNCSSVCMNPQSR